MGVGQAATGALDRISYTLDWSNPLAATMDEVIKGVLDYVGADDWFDWVTGDSDLLQETAAQWRASAGRLRDVVADLQAERKALAHDWAGEASEAFQQRMQKFEDAILGEAEDAITIAELLEQAAAACAIAEEAMQDLLVELVEVVLASLATTAVLSLLTAGAAAAIGPVVAAAGAASKIAKASRIAGSLATKLDDLAKSLQLMRKAAKLRRFLRSKDVGKTMKGARKRIALDLLRGNRPDAGDVAQYMAVKQVKSTVKGVMGVDVAGAVTGAATENSPAYAEERREYEARETPRSFEERSGRSEGHTGKPVKDVFG
ncbi:WXG100 family type VII secretion target [Streptomyces sp. UC4497]